MDPTFLILIVAMLAAFVFLSMRNQKKQRAAMENLQSSAVPGARVQLSSGLFGTIVSDDGGDSVDVEIAPGVVTTWNRLAIREVVKEQDDAAVTPADDTAVTPADDTAATAAEDTDAPHTDSDADDK
ncbi:MAG: preprotein translocase subunit YajC [Gordonia sp. (in: high G+C Gram-positive bacteria)]|uniref:preprotein translocase subunit YajC n=1 Tax=Gordonia sp. (in: high G+C Gram-positive bacteria) TaxID=84139 RepID=UPI0039E24F6E